MTTTNPYVNAKLAKHRALAAEWQQGWNNAAAGKGLISVNGEWMAGWPCPIKRPLDAINGK